MKQIWLLAVCAAFLNFVRTAEESGRDLYSSRYDNLNVDSILGSKRLVTNYAECLLNRKPCPPEGKDLKRILPEALRTKCSRCSITQKENALKIITRLYERYPDQYNNLATKWDPTGEYNRRFVEYLNNKEYNQISNEERPVNNAVIEQVQVQEFEPFVPPSTIPPTRTTARPTTAPTEPPTPRPTERPTALPTIRPLVLSIPTVSPLFFSQFFPTQRPTRSPELRPPVTQNYLDFETTTDKQIEIGNRFGLDDGSVVSVVTRRQQPQAPTTTPRPRTSTKPQIPTIRPFENQPIVTYFNNLGSKLTNTAELIAGMFRNTVRVIIGVDPITHQSA